MTVRVLVLHNVSPDSYKRYDARTSRLHHAHTFTLESDLAAHALAKRFYVLDYIWMLTNIDATRIMATYADQAMDYRERRNRSLSIGDALVLLDEETILSAYGANSLGFEEIDVPKFDRSDIDNRREHSLAYDASIAYHARRRA